MANLLLADPEQQSNIHSPFSSILVSTNSRWKYLAVLLNAPLGSPASLSAGAGQGVSTGFLELLMKTAAAAVRVKQNNKVEVWKTKTVCCRRG